MQVAFATERLCVGADLQYVALLVLYVFTGGLEWFNNTGWPQNFTEIQEALGNTSNTTTGSCVRNRTVANMYYDDILLPDHCCWFGVDCCLIETCPPDIYVSDVSVTQCNCTIGLVTGLNLMNNNVSQRQGASRVHSCLNNMLGTT